LGCPTWDLPTITDFASAHKYQGVEVRIVSGELYLPKCPCFSPGNIASSKRMIADKNLVITDLGSGAQIHFSNGADFEKNMDEAKRFIDLAHQLGCKYVRVFPEKLLAGDERKKSLDTITENLKTLGQYAKDSGVTVLIESHGDLVDMNDLQYVMQHSENANVAMVWDIHNMWSVTKQPPTQVFKKLGKYIRHVHVKDAATVNGKEQYVLLGQGDVPLHEAIKLLVNANYQGFYSLEWEKLWHPELAGPEIALAQYPGAVRKYFER
jgi:sugar phosphate isomerase/epimerase